MDGEFDVFDPEPFDTQKLLKPENPIEEACKFIKPILQMPCEDVDFWVIAFRVYSYKDKVFCLFKRNLKIRSEKWNWKRPSNNGPEILVLIKESLFAFPKISGPTLTGHDSPKSPVSLIC